MSTFPWRTLLFISVALNLLTIGVIAGAYGAGVRVERGAPSAVVDRMPGPRAFIRALPEESRTKVRERLATSWQDSRDLRRAAGEARTAAFDAAAAEPFDVERVRAAFAELRQADQRAIGVFHDNVVDAFAEMSAEERRQAIAALRAAPPARRERVAPERDAEDGALLTPEERQARRERRQERRERWRERRERQQQP
jgi:uncharacterized membrane protein